jgi:nitroimidazol reductase NimA-like FMN-containing flavoprotein (pyridoxamine 5'-phosphate oxidase superfamily)
MCASIMKDAIQLVRDVLTTQRLAVLATHSGGQPHTSLVAFLVTDDLRQIIFATTRSTRKYRNITEDPRVAVFVDDARNDQADFRDATAITAVGTAREVPDDQCPAHVERYLQRHPALREFISSPTCALMQIDVVKYDVVYRFQNVMEVYM